MKNPLIVDIISEKGETLVLSSPLEVTQDLHKSLKGLEVEISKSLKSQLKSKAFKESDVMEDSYCTQIMSLASSIAFTKAVEDSFHDLQPLRAQLEDQLRTLSQRRDWREDSIARHRGSLEVIEFIQHLDTLESLIKAQVDSPTDWEWTKTLRFYSRNEGVFIEMVKGCFEYSWEFQGTVQRLVHTPLTDKCFLVLTQALQRGFGGSLFGPAGTGKTESVKALAQALGRQVMVFNCDEQFEISSISRVFVGLMSCGFWGCFDEFNRLETNVLSSLAHQIQIIQVHRNLTLFLTLLVTLFRNS